MIRPVFIVFNDEEYLKQHPADRKFYGESWYHTPHYKRTR